MRTRAGRKRTRISRQRSKAFALRSALLRLRTRLRLPSLRSSRAFAALIAVTMCAMICWFWLDLSFYVFAAEVSAAPGTSEDQLFRASGLSGLSVFFIREGQVREKLQEVVPAAVDVRVSCALPNRVRVVVSERPGKAIWQSKQGDYWVDGDGQVLRACEDSSDQYPRIVCLDNDAATLGGRVDPSAVAAVLELRRLLPGVNRFEYSRLTGLVLVDARGWRVYFGDDGSLAEKVASMRVLVDKVVSTRAAAKVMDVRFLGSAYYR